MSVGDAITLFGGLIAVFGFAIEAVAIAGMTFYPVRRALPFKSPIALQGMGCTCFTAGVLILIAGRALP